MDDPNRIDLSKRVNYLVERKKGGKFLYSNFRSMLEIGITPFEGRESIRPQLGDYEHLVFDVLLQISLSSFYPIL